MNDYRAIKTGAGRSRDKLAPGATVDAHKASVRFIAKALADRLDGMDAVVVTHMAPPHRSLFAGIRSIQSGPAISTGATRATAKR
jgi:hypothetical protein